MLYIDLLFSLALFIMGIIFLVTKRYKKNVWIIVLALFFFPISLFTYYFKSFDVILFGNISLLSVIVYPLLKIIIILALVRYIIAKKKGSGESYRE